MTELGSRGRFLLLYGSQTGQAQAIAEQIRERSLTRGFDPELHCLDQAEKKFFLDKEPVFVVVVSSTGDGDPPDNAVKFWRKLRRKTLPKDHLSSCKFALLGLGDTNYANFCNMGKMMNKRLLELGAISFHPPGFADDGVGLDIVVEPWIDGLWSPLSSLLLGSSSETQSIPKNTGTELKTSLFGIADSALAEQQSLKDRTGTVMFEGDDGGLRTGTVMFEGDDGGNKRIKGRIGRAEMDGGDDVRGTESGPANLSQTISPSAEVAVTPAPSLGAEVEFDGVDGLSDDNDGITSSTAAEVAPSLLSGILQNLDLSDSSLIDPLAKVEGQDDVDMSTDRTVDESCDQALITSLRTRLTGLTGCTLSLPSATHAYLQVLLTENVGVDKGVEPIFPFGSISYGYKKAPISMATIVGSRLLTKEGSHKKTMELQLEVPGLVYQPGDAFGFICPNNSTEVQWLVERLGLTDGADKMMELSVLSGTDKKNAALPKHVPRCCSVWQFFTQCADIRTVPKKAFLHLLSSFCCDDDDSRRLLELSSRQGGRDYSTLFTELRTDFLDVLHFFPSCHPPVERLIELLPRLQPRYYSATSCPTSSGVGNLRIAFNVENLPPRSSWNPVLPPMELRKCSKRTGLATGWLEREALLVQNTVARRKVPLFPRNLNPFHMPADDSHSIVMIGPGTGVSPFMGFLESREQTLGTQRQGAVGKAWLFFGCRHPEADHIYKEEMNHFVSVGCLTHLHVAYSRVSPTGNHVLLGQTAAVMDPIQLRYVQDLMRVHWKELGLWMVEDKAYVFVCGDAKNMAKDVHAALLDVLEHFIQATCPNDIQTAAMLAEDMVSKMKEEGRYLVDSW